MLKSIGEIHGLIYVLRDPRDIVCSGAAYFKLRSFREKYGNNASKYDAMIHTIANGSNYPHCHMPWSDHVRGNLGTEATFVRYEDLLEQPTKTIATLLAQLKIERSENRICQAVAAQSFDHVKEKFEKSGAVFKANFLRKGRKAAYLEELTPAQQSQIAEGSSEIMKLHGYI